MSPQTLNLHILFKNRKKVYLGAVKLHITAFHAQTNPVHTCPDVRLPYACTQAHLVLCSDGLHGRELRQLHSRLTHSPAGLKQMPRL